MAEPQRQNTDEDAVTILRRLEPVLAGMDERLKTVELVQQQHGERLARIEERMQGVEGHIQSLEHRVQSLETTQQHQGERLARVDGAVSQLPNLWQITSIQTAIIAVVIAAGGALRAKSDQVESPDR